MTTPDTMTDPHVEAVARAMCGAVMAGDAEPCERCRQKAPKAIAAYRKSLADARIGERSVREAAPNA